MAYFRTFVLVLIVNFSLAQSNPEDKKLDEAYKLIKKEKYKEADSYLEKVLVDAPNYAPGWVLLSKLRYKEYEDAKKSDNLFGNIAVSVKDKDGKEKKDGDSLSTALLSLLQNISPSKTALDKYYYTLRRATLTCNECDRACAILRATFIDVDVDTMIGKKALRYFNEAEQEFGKKNYEASAKNYKRALEEQPNFYKAALYLGDSYYFTENYELAALAFKDASNKYPFLLEPRKYLVDAFYKQKLYEKCTDECMEAMKVYPDYMIASRLEDGLYYQNKKLNVKWMPRGTFPNKINDTSSKNLNKYLPKEPFIENKCWEYYINAAKKVTKYCNKKGIITELNDITKQRYLELYSWEEMLKNSNDESLKEAKRMKEEGFLDCYVMVTCFHHDIYDQYKDFVFRNKERIALYFKKYIVTKI